MIIDVKEAKDQALGRDRFNYRIDILCLENGDTLV